MFFTNSYFHLLQREELAEQSSYSDRENLLVNLLNSDPNLDLQLMEGVKLLMALSAVQLYGDMEQGKDVPVFAWLLFARDSSENVPSFVRNHLNRVGNAGGLEQVRDDTEIVNVHLYKILRFF